jgi:peptidoglycan/xylan/chitin deacetylase (PgdA/CDA1 family)
LILAYHNVVPDDAPPAGDRSLHLPRAAFAAQLDILVERCTVVPLGDLPDAALEADRPTARPVVAVTFDDAYRGAVTDGVSELVRRGLPATIFVAPKYVDGGAFWWDELTPPGALAPAILRSFALEGLQGDDQSIRAWASKHGVPVTPPPSHARVASESELSAAVRKPGITLGSHTWSHPYLPSLSYEEISRELTESWSWLRQRFSDRLVPWISYPYGGVSEDVEEVAAATGHRAGLCISGGRVSRRAWERPHALPRYNVPAGLTARGFRVRVGGGAE